MASDLYDPNWVPDEGWEEPCPVCEGSGTVLADEAWLEANEPIGDGWQGFRPVFPCPRCHPTRTNLRKEDNG